MKTHTTKLTEIIIIRTCKETLEQEEVTLEYAIQKCESYWVNIKEMLLTNTTLCTPYAYYQLKNQTK
jgi:hypothetical protein